MNKIFLVASLLIIYSCTSINSHFAELKAEREKCRKNLCLNKGFKPNTDSFTLGLENLELQSQVNEANRKARKSNSRLYMIRQQCIIDGGIMIGNTCDKD